MTCCATDCSLLQDSGRAARSANVRTAARHCVWHACRGKPFPQSTHQCVKVVIHPGIVQQRAHGGGRQGAGAGRRCFLGSRLVGRRDGRGATSHACGAGRPDAARQGPCCRPHSFRSRRAHKRASPARGGQGDAVSERGAPDARAGGGCPPAGARGSAARTARSKTLRAACGPAGAPCQGCGCDHRNVVRGWRLWMILRICSA